MIDKVKTLLFELQSLWSSCLLKVHGGYDRIESDPKPMFFTPKVLKAISWDRNSTLREDHL